MLTLRQPFYFCPSALAALVVASAVCGEAQAQSLPNELVEQYNNCVGTELNEIDREPIFEGDRLRALPAPPQMDLDLGIAAGNCLADATDNLWAYDPLRYLFSTGTRYQQALNAQTSAVLTQQQERRAAQAQAQAEEAARLVAELELVVQERQAAVWSATYDACVALYQDDTVAALTNQICQPLFLEIGLPSD